MAYNRKPTLECETNPSADCAVEAAMAVLSGKWKLKIYKMLRSNDALRFHEIKTEIGAISDKTLTAQLKEMEEDNLLTRTVYPKVPPRVEYNLTPLGKKLNNVLFALDQWGRAYVYEMRGGILPELD
ncbi:HxlR family transcriptional regulator [Elizabethkingia sp. YR214]|nr:HxlR family transcriptional regulator [Elizabethkingia sp. YR214]